MKPGALLYLPWSFDMLGGVDVAVDRLRIGLEREGRYRPLIGVHDWTAFRPAKRDAEGRTFLPVALPALPDRSSVGSHLRFSVSALRRAVQLSSQLRIENVAVFNAHFPTPSILVVALMLRLRLWRGKLVLSFHGSDVKAISATSLVWRLIAEETSSVTTCSEALARDVRRLNLFNRRSITVIHNGIDVDEFRAQGMKTAWPEFIGKRYVLSVGGFVPNKAQDLIIKAFARVSLEFPDLFLVLAGGQDNGEWLGHLKYLVEELHLQRRVLFLVNVQHDRVASLMHSACLFVHAARSEAFGLVLIEAGAMGVPLVAASVGGVPEVIRGDTGRLYECGSVDQLVDNIRCALNDAAGSLAMAELMKRRVSDRFSIKAMASNYVNLYK